MRILVCYRINEYSTKMAGVFQKMLGQLEGFSTQPGVEVYAMYMSRNRFYISRYANRVLTPLVDVQPIAIDGERDRFWRLGMQHAADILPDLVYCRYDNQYDTRALTDFCQHYQKHLGSVTVIEFPTYPYEKEINDKDKLAGDLLRRPALLEQVDFVASTYNSTRLLGKENAYFTNKIDLTNTRLVDVNQTKGGDSEWQLLALANVSDWHGYDRLLNAIGQRAKSDNSMNLHLHIVGDGNALPELQALCKELAIEQYVTFHGFVAYPDLAAILQRSHVGIDSLGLHRKGLTHSCSLKTRSYIANGLPIITAAIDEDIVGQSWVIPCSADETPLQLDLIISKLDELYQRCDLNAQIATFASQHLGWAKHAQIILNHADNYQRRCEQAN